jgi:hypothetical protein
MRHAQFLKNLSAAHLLELPPCDCIWIYKPVAGRQKDFSMRIGERDKSPKGSSGEWKGAGHPLHGNGQQRFVGELTAQLTKARERVIPGEWAGGIPEEMATLPQLRVRCHWYSFGQALTLLVVVSGICLVAGIFLAQYLRTLPAVQALQSVKL